MIVQGYLVRSNYQYIIILKYRYIISFLWKKFTRYFLFIKGRHIFPCFQQTMGFDESSVETIFDITAGLIHIGELEFEAQDEDEAAMLSEEEENM